MKNPGEIPPGGLRGVAALFDDKERKDLFRKYVFFLGWLELLILLICWLYQLGDGGQDRFGPVEITFPWKGYFLLAFLAPVTITFLIGVIIAGFNRYFGEPGASGVEPGATAEGTSDGDHDRSGKIHQLTRMVSLLQRLPFLALLLLLGVGALFFYRLDAMLAFIGAVGEHSARVLLLSAVVILAVASVFALILIVLNYQLRKRAMEYQYKSQVAERFGLIILEDNTVLNSEGKLLINGKKMKGAVPLLTAQTGECRPSEEPAGPVPRPSGFETT